MPPLLHGRAAYTLEGAQVKAYVVGGGSSRDTFDWSQVQGDDFTVACHEAANAMPFAPDVQLSVDRPYWVANKPRLGSAGVWVTVGGQAGGSKVDRSILRVPCVSGADHWREAWSDNLGHGVMVGGCSGIAAMNYAALRGAREIHLVGIDLDGGASPETLERLRAGFSYAVQCCEDRGIKVVCHGKWAPVAA